MGGLFGLGAMGVRTSFPSLYSCPNRSVAGWLGLRETSGVTLCGRRRVGSVTDMRSAFIQASTRDLALNNSFVS